VSDIVARLAVHAWRSDGWTRADCAEAAAEIERLRGERDRLRKIVQDLLSVMPVLPVAAKHIVGMEDRYNSAITNASTALKETGHE
jgi:hypothetical protein